MSSSRWRSGASGRGLIALLAALVLTAAACASDAPEDSAAGGDLPAASEPVRIADTSWESLWVHNEIISYIIQHGYGRDTEIITVAIPVMQQAMLQEELDVMIEVYPQNIREWWEESVASGDLLDLGHILEASYRGFYVPRYVIEGDAERGIEASAPDLVRIQDLARYAHVFADPEDPGKGQLVNCIIEWACLDTVRAKIASYGLDEHYNLLEAGSGAAMDAAIVGPYQRGEPVVFYYWEPTWLVAELDLVKLEQEPFTEECEQATNAIAAGEREPGPDARCAFPEPAVHKAITPGFAERAPDVTEFLAEMFMGTELVGELNAWMNANDAEPEDVAMLFFVEHEEQWRGWLPDDVADRVAAALVADGIMLSG